MQTLTAKLQAISVYITELYCTITNDGMQYMKQNNPKLQVVANKISDKKFKSMTRMSRNQFWVKAYNI